MLGLAQRYGTASLLMIQTVVILIWVAVNAALGVRYGHSHPSSCTYLVHGEPHVRSTSPQTAHSRSANRAPRASGQGSAVG